MHVVSSMTMLGLATPVLTQSAEPFNLSRLTLHPSRWQDNQDRTLSYLHYVDLDRLLYNFRSNHGLSTAGAAVNGGWDAPDFPFRSHTQGHFLSAWAQCYASLSDDECRSRAVSFVSELAKCQANNDAVGFSEGYLSGFPESDFAKLENGTLDNGNVPYYCIHKTMAGLLDVWQHIGDETARVVLLGMAGWVDTRTAALPEAVMQTVVLETEFGGMNDIMALLYTATGDERWLDVGARFDHAAVMDPIAAGTDDLDGLHANTQAQKLVGAMNEFFATGTQRYLTIARNAWDIITGAHTYAIGGNSQAEHFHAANAIASYLDNDTAETCNTYNMLKLTRELWRNAPNDSTTAYFDFYEGALLNHLLGVQDPSSAHGHVTYFTSLNPGALRGLGPAWGGGTYSTDYDTFWCCQSTSLETFTKLVDSVYWHAGDDDLYVNLFIPSSVEWTVKGVTVTQDTDIPVGDTTSISVGGSGSFTMHIRIPGWAETNASVTVNGEDYGSTTAVAGSYFVLERDWSDGDTVSVRLPMKLRTIPANDDEGVAALAWGPTVLAGNYTGQELKDLPTIDVDSVERTGGDDGGLVFEGTAGGESVQLLPFYDAQGWEYTVYWKLA
ncbi:Uncharacterized conserved protein, DUF1680 family [Geosmithia morbida]|uniref:Uncharacterized conserved protein, DUF1680 family n=1 Tax=Geosmithia morbida TaxID=1094350 RepID=A0A9P4YQF5_9HYPO|nr:Uncharacterized conserved protein, DUF1680 family [Geosmithia morbida]KAF4119917.1 Uncharacterized conserved protein, DUF1680 family [Geosmithia morbida]